MGSKPLLQNRSAYTLPLLTVRPAPLLQLQPALPLTCHLLHQIPAIDLAFEIRNNLEDAFVGYTSRGTLIWTAHSTTPPPPGLFFNLINCSLLTPGSSSWAHHDCWAGAYCAWQTQLLTFLLCISFAHPISSFQNCSSPIGSAFDKNTKPK